MFDIFGSCSRSCWLIQLRRRNKFDQTKRFLFKYEENPSPPHADHLLFFLQNFSCSEGRGVEMVWSVPRSAGPFSPVLSDSGVVPIIAGEGGGGTWRMGGNWQRNEANGDDDGC